MFEMEFKTPLKWPKTQYELLSLTKITKESSNIFYF